MLVKPWTMLLLAVLIVVIGVGVIEFMRAPAVTIVDSQAPGTGS